MPVEYERDGRDHFYRILDPWPGLVDAHAVAARIEAKLARIPSVDARAKAVLLRTLMRDLDREMRGVEFRTASHGTDAVRNRLDATRRRPAGSGRLRGAITSRPITGPVPLGAVGIGDIDVLDRRAVGVRHSGRGGTAGRQPYWHVQEEGSTHLVGRTMVGFFSPGFSRPNPMQFRQHPLFSTQAGGHGYGGPMTVKRPIEPKYFLRDGSKDAEKFRYRETVRVTMMSVARARTILAVGSKGRRL